MSFDGYPLDANRTNATPQTTRHPTDHNQERAALNDLQAQIVAFGPAGLQPQIDAIVADVAEAFDQIAALQIRVSDYTHYYEEPGAAITGSFAGEATIATLAVEDNGPGIYELRGLLFVSKNAADIHYVRLRLDGTLVASWRSFGRTQDMCAPERSVVCLSGEHTVTMSMLRDATTSNANATTFADVLSNRLEIKFVAADAFIG